MPGDEEESAPDEVVSEEMGEVVVVEVVDEIVGKEEEKMIERKKRVASRLFKVTCRKNVNNTRGKIKGIGSNDAIELNVTYVNREKSQQHRRRRL